MKIQYRQPMFFSATICVVLIEWASLCFGGDGESTLMMDKKVSQIEDAWKMGEVREYYAQASSIAQDITATHAQAGVSAVAATLLQNLMSKEIPPSVIGADDLWIMGKLASSLISATNVSVADRRNNVQLLSKFLGKIRSEIVPGFTPKLVVANVPPPAGVAGAAGMSPEAISDPIARAKYEASIRENQENTRLNSRQTALRRIEKQINKSVVEYMAQTFRTNSVSSDFINGCINAAKLNDSEREEVLSKVGP